MKSTASEFEPGQRSRTVLVIYGILTKIYSVQSKVT